jgi:hypothetical protein
MSTVRIRLEVCPSSKVWRVTKKGTLFFTYVRQADAIAGAVVLAKELEKGGQLVTLKIKRRDGTIRDERTYPRSSDPRRSKG